MKVWVPAAKAAEYEEIPYNTLKVRIHRKQYEVKREPNAAGGQPLVYIALPSLSSKAQARYHKANPGLVVRDLVDSVTEDQEAPWYVSCDPNEYNDMIAKQGGYPVKKRQLCLAINDFLSYCGEDRTAYAQQLAQEHGISLSAFYGYVDDTKRARCWMDKRQQEGIPVQADYEMMCLMRKPRSKNTFPSIFDDMKKRIQATMLDKMNRQNRASMALEHELLLEDLEAEGRLNEAPSYNNYCRFRQYLLKNDPRSKQAFHFQKLGERDYKNKMMLKGKRSTRGLMAFEILEGDSHTFDFFAAIVDPDGTRRAIRPTLTSWIDLKTRTIHGWIISENVNARIVKESIFKSIYDEGGGVPMHLHMDNGKEYTARETTGQKRSERACLFAGLEQGFIETMGIRGYNRSLPYQPWDKAYIERYHGTLTEQFSKRFPSYAPCVWHEP